MILKNIAITATALIAVAAIYNYRCRKRKDPPIFSTIFIPGAKTVPPFGIFVPEHERNNKELIDAQTAIWNTYQQKGLIRFYYNKYKTQPIDTVNLTELTT